MNLNSKYYFDNYGYRVGDTRCRSGKCCNLISVGCIQWDFPSTELYNKKETLEEILRKIEELLLQDNSNFPISNVGGGYELYAGVYNGENTFRTLIADDGIIITQNAETIQIGFDTSSIPQQGVTSVAMTVPTGFTVGGSPITSTGTFALNYAAGYTGYTTAEQSKLGGIEAGAQVNVPETDPTVPAHVKSILAGDISNWNTAFGWGNHADAGYLTTETDPTVPLHVKGILTTDINNWNTAYGWGNHAGAGYLTTETDPTVPSHVKGITTTNINNWNSAYAQRIQTFTTTGNSGAATFTGNTLNIPNYTLSGLGGVPTSRTITINGTTQDLSTNRTWNIVPDYSSLTDDFHIKKTSSGLADSKTKDTAIGIETSGITDSYLVVERRTQASANTTFTIDLNNPSGHFDLTLTGNTIISFSNMIDINKSTVVTLVINGGYSLMFPSWLKPMPDNDSYFSNLASDVNMVVILIRNGGGSPAGIYSLKNVSLI